MKNIGITILFCVIISPMYAKSMSIIEDNDHQNPEGNNHKVIVDMGITPNMTEDQKEELFEQRRILAEVENSKDNVAYSVALENFYNFYWKTHEVEEEDYMDIAKHYFIAKNYERTAYWLQQIKDADELENVDEYYCFWGEFYYSKKDYKQALFYYEKSLENGARQSNTFWVAGPKSYDCKKRLNLL